MSMGANMDAASVEFLISYDQELRQMSRPDKAIINNLTMLAADHMENITVCSGIIRTVERCVKDAPPHKKLIPLYVMDSIIKNVGKIFTRLFLQNLTDIFCEAFGQVDNKTRESFIKLLDTWQTQNVFSPEKNTEIRGRLAVLLTQQVANDRSVPPPMHHGNGVGVPGYGSQLDGMLSIQQQQQALQNRVDGLLALQMRQQQVPTQQQQMQAPYMMQNQVPLQQCFPQDHNGPPPMITSNQQGGPFLQHPQHGPIPPQGMQHVAGPAPVQQVNAQPLPGFMNQGPQGLMMPHNQMQQSQVGAEPNPLQDLLQTIQQHQSGSGHSPVNPPADLQPRTLNITELNSRDVADVIKQLYDDQQFTCDGRRFKTAEERDKHLDRVFQQNRAKKDGGASSERHWFRKVDEWTSSEDASSRPGQKGGALQPLNVEGNKAMEVEETPAQICTAAEDGEIGARCVACNEELKAEWDGEEEKWVFWGVRRVQRNGGAGGDGRETLLVHCKCFQPGGSYSQPSSPLGVFTPRAAADPQWSSTVKHEDAA